METKNEGWSIDRVKTKDEIVYKKIEENFPNVVSQMVVEEVLKNIGGSDWNDPLEVSKTIGKMMSIDVDNDISSQCPQIFNMDLTIMTFNAKDKSMPFWICQNIIRVDEKFDNRYINYDGSKYNKIDIIFTSDYFKNQLNKVAKAAHCNWNVRWGAAKNSENKLHRKTRPGVSGKNETWLDKNVNSILTDKDINGINIKNLIMIEFKRNC
jgi:hypothetical protein